MDKHQIENEIVKRLRENGPNTRDSLAGEIADEYGLFFPDVGDIINGMIESGRVDREGSQFAFDYYISVRK